MVAEQEVLAEWTSKLGVSGFRGMDLGHSCWMRALYLFLLGGYRCGEKYKHSKPAVE